MSSQVSMLPIGGQRITGQEVRNQNGNLHKESIIKYLLFSYNDAMAIIRKAQSVEYNFQLVVTRVFDEGEDDILDHEEDSVFHGLRPWGSNYLSRFIDSVRVFLIGEELGFRVGFREDQTTLVWRDLAGHNDDTYEFVVTRANNLNAIELFTQCMYRSVYQRKYRWSSDDASSKDLQEFVAK